LSREKFSIFSNLLESNNVITILLSFSNSGNNPITIAIFNKRMMDPQNPSFRFSPIVFCGHVFVFFFRQVKSQLRWVLTLFFVLLFNHLFYHLFGFVSNCFGITVIIEFKMIVSCIFFSINDINLLMSHFIKDFNT